MVNVDNPNSPPSPSQMDIIYFLHLPLLPSPLPSRYSPPVWKVIQSLERSLAQRQEASPCTSKQLSWTESNRLMWIFIFLFWANALLIISCLSTSVGWRLPGKVGENFVNLGRAKALITCQVSQCCEDFAGYSNAPTSFPGESWCRRNFRHLQG